MKESSLKCSSTKYSSRLTSNNTPKISENEDDINLQRASRERNTVFSEESRVGVALNLNSNATTNNGTSLPRLQREVVYIQVFHTPSNPSSVWGEANSVQVCNGSENTAMLSSAGIRGKGGPNKNLGTEGLSAPIIWRPRNPWCHRGRDQSDSSSLNASEWCFQEDERERLSYTYDACLVKILKVEREFWLDLITSL